MLAHVKRAHSPSPDPTSPSEIASTASDSSDAPPRKRRVPTEYAPSSDDGFSSTTTGSHLPRRKRRYSSEDEDNAPSDTWSTSAVGRGRWPGEEGEAGGRRGAAGGGMAKRVRRELSDSFSRFNLQEAAAAAASLPSTTTNTGASGYSDIDNAAEALGLSSSENTPTISDDDDAGSGSPSAGDVPPSSVIQPGDIGPAVWVRHATANDEYETRVGLRTEEVDDRAVGFWRGERPVELSDHSVYLPPGYLRAHPDLTFFPSPQDDWRNPERGLVIYKPVPNIGVPLPPPSTTTQQQSPPDSPGMELDSYPTPAPYASIVPLNADMPDISSAAAAERNWLASGMAGPDTPTVRLGGYAGESAGPADDGGGMDVD